MKSRLAAMVLVALMGTFGTFCKNQKPPLIVVHVLRSPPKAFSELEAVTFKFGLEKPHISNGKGMMIATYEGSAYREELKHADRMQPDVIIFTPASDSSSLDPAIRDKLGRPTSVCRDKIAYVPTWVTGETREAADVYLQFLLKHCPSSN
jgi:hypothetical protein